MYLDDEKIVTLGGGRGDSDDEEEAYDDTQKSFVLGTITVDGRCVSATWTLSIKSRSMVR